MYFRARPNEYKAQLIKKFNEKVLPGFESGKFKIFIDKFVQVNFDDKASAKQVRAI